MAKSLFSKLRVSALVAAAMAVAAYPIATAAAAAGKLYGYLSGLTVPSVGTQLGANTLTGLIPTLYAAMNEVSRELVGMIPAVRRDVGAERAAVGQVVRVPMAEAGAIEDVTASQLPPDTGDTTPEYIDLSITKSRSVPIKWNGEEQLAVGSTGTYNQILADQFSDAMRKLVNEMEFDLATEGKATASRAYGAAGTAPFGTAGDLSDFAGARQILEDNGAPTSDLQLVMGSAAMANLRGKQSVLFKVNEAGSSDMLRNGLTDRIQGFALRNSAGVRLHNKGTGAAYVTSGATAAGVRSIALVTGAGTVLAGDIATFAADAGNKYVVGSGVTAPGTIALNRPGARVLIPTANAMTIGNSYTPNLAFARNAIVLVARAPAMPTGGDSADDSMMLTDPVTGLTFEVLIYRGRRQITYRVEAAWGVRGVKSAHIATLIG